MITAHTLFAATEEAQRRLSLLSPKYPALNCYLVLCKGMLQADVPLSPEDVLKTCPELVVDGDCKKRCQRLLSSGHAEALSLESSGLTFIEGVNIEIRFGVLNYEQIWQLQQDELIDKESTPQTKASIRIVAGTVINLARR